MKRFKITGICIPEEDFMVDTSHKISQIMNMVKQKDYFVINRPRQYGKTTTLSLLEKELLKTGEYLPIRLSFEGIGDAPFQSMETFGPILLSYLSEEFNVVKFGFSHLFAEKQKTVNNFDTLSKAITLILTQIDKKVVLMIDEVDKSSDSEIFVYFLGMLMDKYLKSQEKKDVTFHNVILAGLHDIKSLKMRIYTAYPGLPSSEERQKQGIEQAKYNSPWNIAVDFKIDLSFTKDDISTMLIDYANCTSNQMDIKAISEKIHFWTNGYPFLVSKVCKTVHEDIINNRNDKTWQSSDIDEAVKILSVEANTIFDVIAKNLQNYPEICEFIRQVIMGKDDMPFELLDPIVNFAYMYGMICKNDNNKVKIHNKIFEEKITNYFVLKEMRNNNPIQNVIQEPYIKMDGRLDFKLILTKFQETIKEKFSSSDLYKSAEFMEKEVRMLFFVFLKPIINGIGFSFKEVQTGAEKRMDVVVVFRDEKFVVELKIWRGEEYHKAGIEQLKGYMKSESVDKGYMMIMNKNQNKEFIHRDEEGIYCVYV